LQTLAAHIKQPSFPLAFRQFLYSLEHPDLDPPSATDACPPFKGKINVHHSVVALFYAPSDLCGAGGMKSECIWSTPSFHGYARRDTVFVVLNDSQPGMEGMEIGRVLLFFSFHYRRKDYSCALINWFVHTDRPDDDTGMWMVELECDRNGLPTVQVIVLFRPGLAWKPRLWPGLRRLWLPQTSGQAKAATHGLAQAWPGPGRGFCM
jgi:hypothetical protein